MLNVQNSKLFSARHTSHLAASRPSVLCSIRAGTVTASASKQIFCFDIDTILSGLEPLYCRVGQECWQHVPAACSAAGQESLVPGSHTLYTKIMAQLLPVVQHPAYEAALLMRLLAEEGVVGEPVQPVPRQLQFDLACAASPAQDEAASLRSSGQLDLHCTYSWF